MAIQPEELYGSSLDYPTLKRVWPDEGGIRVKKLAAISGAPTIKHLTALSWDAANERFVPFDRASAVGEAWTLTAASTTATDGTFTLTFNGQTTAAIDHDAAAAAIQAALEGLAAIDSGDVAVVDSGGGLAADDGVATITFGGQYLGDVTVISATFNLTGNDHVLANTVSGSGGAATLVDGFAYSPNEDIDAHASNDVLIPVMLAGSIDIADVIMHDTGVAPVSADEPYFQAQRVRQLGLRIVGLADVA